MQCDTDDEVSPFSVLCKFIHLIAKSAGSRAFRRLATNKKLSPGLVSDDDPYVIQLLRQAHIAYLIKALTVLLTRGFVSLDASHPWMVYWCLHSLDLLGYFHDNDNDSAIVTASNIFNSNENDNEVAKKTNSMEEETTSMRAKKSSSSCCMEEKPNL